MVRRVCGLVLFYNYPVWLYVQSAFSSRKDVFRYTRERRDLFAQGCLKPECLDAVITFVEYDRIYHLGRKITVIKFPAIVFKGREFELMKRPIYINTLV